MLHEQRLFKTVSITDPAIDRDAVGGPEGIVAWGQERDIAKLPIQSGATPVTFYLRTLGGLKAHQLIGTAPTDADSWTRAFRACVMRVDGFNGSPSWEPVRVRDASLENLGAILTDAEMDAFHISTIYEIGAVAYGLAFFPSTTGRKFVLPRLSGQIWDYQEGFRRAAATNATAPTTGPTDDKPDEG